MWKIVASLLLCLPVSILAQSAGGVAGIAGTVRDSTGAVVPNVKVTIASASQGDIRSITTNASGIFTAPGLPPGTGYQVTVSAPGFAAYELTNIDLQVGQNLNLNVDLTVAQSTTSVQVSAVAQLVNDSKSDVSQVVGERDIMNLPINGRRVASGCFTIPPLWNPVRPHRGVRGLPKAPAKRHHQWKCARSWLRRCPGAEPPPPSRRHRSR